MVIERCLALPEQGNGNTHSSVSASRHCGGLQRRQALQFTAATLALGGMAPALQVRPALADAGKRSPDREFRIWRKGEDIGRNHVSFVAEGGGFRVHTTTDIAVTFAFVTAFRFEQQGEDLWQDGLLLHSRVKTNDNGDHSVVELEARPGTVLVDGPNGKLEAPKGLMTDICFWNADITRQSQLLDAGKGELAQVSARHTGRQVIDVRGAEVEADHFTFESSLGRTGDIWYKDGVWVRGRLVARGEVLDYELV